MIKPRIDKIQGATFDNNKWRVVFDSQRPTSDVAKMVISRRRLARQLIIEANIKKWNHLFLFSNSALLLLAITLMCVMVSLESHWSYFKPFLQIHKEIHGMGVIATGCAICIAACFGYLVSCTQKSTHFIWYGLGILVMLVLDMKIIITGIANEDFARRYIGRSFLDEMEKYNRSAESERAIDIAQLTLRCCGSENYTDWDTKRGCMPYTCCPTSAIFNTTCPCSSTFFETPCLDRLSVLPELGLVLIYCVVAVLISMKTLCLLITVKLEKLYRT